jgi:SAM-dependent methyltransferase
MRDPVTSLYEQYPDPSPALAPIAPGQLDRIDDGLHYGWAWHRHRYCYRDAKDLSVLDAGCGTGLSTLGLARLNPGARVVGIDASPRSLELARERAAASATVAERVEFRDHDLDQPIPREWGSFDFIVCRRVLAHVEEPVRVLKHLAAALDDRGLLYLTIPARAGRQPVCQFRQAVEVLSGPGASLDERVEIAQDLFRILRPDHPVRRYEAAHSGAGLPGPERIVAGYLDTSDRDWTLVEANDLLDRAGLQFLYAATRRPWRSDDVFVGNAPSERLKARVDGLDSTHLAELIDAVNPSLHADEYRIYACPADFEPRTPGWMERRRDQPGLLDRLVPHRTGLAWPDPLPTAAGVVPSSVRFASVLGTYAEVDRHTELLFRGVNGSSPCVEITARAMAQSGVADSPQTWQGRWLDLTNMGFILLEPPDLRDRVDCRHLGPIVDRLDCACPRRWLRACALHGHCTIAAVAPDDDKYATLQAALDRNDLAAVVSCEKCADYVADE